MSPDEEPLTGGFVNTITKVGDTVRRTAGPWTPAVHALLRHLEREGFAESPRVLGIDDQGREILTYLPGETIAWTDWPGELLTNEGPVLLGQLLRRYHDVVRTFHPPDGAVWRNPLAPARAELIRHGDFSPFNTTWLGGRPIGVIDWDFALPGRAIDDLAYLAWYLVPLQAEPRVREYGMPADVDRIGRLSTLCDAYGGDYSPAAVVAAAIELIETERLHTIELAARGLHPWTRFAADGAIDAFAREAGWIRQHLRV